MSYLHVWHNVPVNKSKRPFLIENEHHLFVKDGVGIYQGKSKIKHHQDGRVYLTNKRVIYLDSKNPAQAVAVDLDEVVNAQYVDKFLRRSPKVKIFLKIVTKPGDGMIGYMAAGAAVSVTVSGRESGSTATDSATQRGGNIQPETSLNQPELVDWVCVICSFNNHLSTHTNLSSSLPKCVSCGIPPSREQLENALRFWGSESSRESKTSPDQCIKCTFINHPSMRFCEVCGAPLKQASNSILRSIEDFETRTSKDLNPLGLVLEDTESYTNESPYVKLSFRKGGDVDFFRHLQEIIDKKKWEALEAKGGISDDSKKLCARETMSKLQTTPKVQSNGIQGLVKFGELQRKQNESILSSSLEDLEQLMYKAQEILDLTSSFSSLVKKPHLPVINMSPLSVTPSSSIYLQELAQHMCEYLLNFQLTKSTSMITTQDLFAAYNRFSVWSQGFGGELVSTQHFQKCLQLFDTLSLPVRLKTFQSGLVVVTQRLHDSQDIHQVIVKYLIAEENRFLYEKYTSELLADTDGYMRDTYRSFRGNSVAEIADHFGWSSTICVEELTRCINEGLLVLDKHVSGTFYFLNKFNPDLAARIDDEDVVRKKAQHDVLSQQKQITSELKMEQESSQSLLLLNDFEFGDRDRDRDRDRDLDRNLYRDRDHGSDGGKLNESSETSVPTSETLGLLSGLRF